MPGLFGGGFIRPRLGVVFGVSLSCHFGRFILLLLFYLVHFHHVRLFKRRPSGIRLRRPWTSDSGETLAIADRSGEAWIFHVLPGPSRPLPGWG